MGGAAVVAVVELCRELDAAFCAMGKTAEEEQSLPSSVRAEASERNAGRRFFGSGCRWISGLVSLRCVLVLVFSAVVFLSALFWLPPFLPLADQRDLDLGSEFKGHEIVASFNVEKPVSLLKGNILQLENDILDEIGYMMTKVVVLSIEPLDGSNVTRVVFAIDPDKKDSKIPPEIQSLIKAAFESLVVNQISLRLTKALFGEPYLFEVLKFPGGITIIPTQSAFLLQNRQILFNFTLNFSIYQIQTNFEELTSQLKMGLHLAHYENMYVSLSNSKGSTVSPPTTVQSSVVLAIGITPPMPRLKQLAQTITGSHSKNLGLNNTEFGRVKQIRLSSILQHSLHGSDGSATSWSPSPSPLPEPHHNHHRHHHLHHHHCHHHHQNGYLAPWLAPVPASEKGSHATTRISPAPAPAPGSDKSSSSPWKSYSANPPCRSHNKRRSTGNTGGKHQSLAPSLAPNVSPRHSPGLPPHYLHLPAPSPVPISRSVPASSPLPNVVFANTQPPSKSDSETQHGSEAPSISPSPSPSSVGHPTKQLALVLLSVLANIICL